MRARLKLVVEYQYNDDKEDMWDSHETIIVDYENEPNEKRALEDWIMWKYRMERHYLIDNVAWSEK